MRRWQLVHKKRQHAYTQFLCVSSFHNGNVMYTMRYAKTEIGGVAFVSSLQIVFRQCLVFGLSSERFRHFCFIREFSVASIWDFKLNLYYIIVGTWFSESEQNSPKQQSNNSIWFNMVQCACVSVWQRRWLTLPNQLLYYFHS